MILLNEHLKKLIESLFNQLLKFIIQSIFLYLIFSENIQNNISENPIWYANDVLVFLG